LIVLSHLLLFLGGFFGFGMAMVIVSLQIGIGEYVNLGYLMTVIHLFSDSSSLSENGLIAIAFFTSYFISIYFAVKKIILNQS
jgi:hypothetical protein